MLMTTDQTLTDWALVRSTLDGHDEAFGTLVQRHQAAALRVATVALGTATGADDVAQEAFVKAYRALDRFRPEAAFAPWLFRLVTNTARNDQRRQRRQAALAVRAGGRAEPPAPGPDDLVQQTATTDVVVAALNRLDLDDRLLLSYRWFEDLTLAEIADALDCPVGTVKSRLHRATGRLRRAVDAESGSATGRET